MKRDGQITLSLDFEELVQKLEKQEVYVLTASDSISSHNSVEHIFGITFFEDEAEAWVELAKIYAKHYTGRGGLRYHHYTSVRLSSKSHKELLAGFRKNLAEGKPYNARREGSNQS